MLNILNLFPFNSQLALSGSHHSKLKRLTTVEITQLWVLLSFERFNSQSETKSRRRHTIRHEFSMLSSFCFISASHYCSSGASSSANRRAKAKELSLNSFTLIHATMNRSWRDDTMEKAQQLDSQRAHEAIWRRCEWSVVQFIKVLSDSMSFEKNYCHSSEKAGQNRAEEARQVFFFCCFSHCISTWNSFNAMHKKEEVGIYAHSRWRVVHDFSLPFAADAASWLHFHFMRNKRGGECLKLLEKRL